MPAIIIIIYLVLVIIIAKNLKKIKNVILMRLFRQKLKSLQNKFTSMHELDNEVNLAIVNHLTKDFSPAKIDKFIFQAAKIAKSEKRQKISMTDINRSWDIVRHGKTVERQQLAKDTRQTALHEAAHAVAYLINCPKHCMYQVSISGRNKTLGHCVHLSYKINEKYTKNDYENFIIAYLAGGISEQYFGENRSLIDNAKEGLNDLVKQTGCRFDLKKAKIIAKNLDTTFKTKSTSTNQILLECYKKSADLVKNNEDKILCLAKKLEKKDVLYVDEIYESMDMTRLKFELE